MYHIILFMNKRFCEGIKVDLEPLYPIMFESALSFYANTIACIVHSIYAHKLYFHCAHTSFLTHLQDAWSDLFLFMERLIKHARNGLFDMPVVGLKPCMPTPNPCQYHVFMCLLTCPLVIVSLLVFLFQVIFKWTQYGSFDSLGVSMASMPTSNVLVLCRLFPSTHLLALASCHVITLHLWH